MIRLLTAAALSLVATAASAQYLGQHSANPYAANRVNPYQSGGSLYSNDGQYLGNANNDRYDPNSTSNPYGEYGSRYSPNSINNPYGQYGSKYSTDSATNPYGDGVKVCGPYGCN